LEYNCEKIVITVLDKKSSFQDMYVGLSPYEAPAIYSLMQYTELTDGFWFPMGGMYRLVEVLTNIAQKWGVQFMYNAPVEQINVDGRRATGVTLTNGQQIQAEVVVLMPTCPMFIVNSCPTMTRQYFRDGQRYLDELDCSNHETIAFSIHERKQ
jgi:phytoene dehydrogenase-like protein